MCNFNKLKKKVYGNKLIYFLYKYPHIVFYHSNVKTIQKESHSNSEKFFFLSKAPSSIESKRKHNVEKERFSGKNVLIYPSVPPLEKLFGGEIRGNSFLVGLHSLTAMQKSMRRLKKDGLTLNVIPLGAISLSDYLDGQDCLRLTEIDLEFTPKKLVISLNAAQENFLKNLQDIQKQCLCLLLVYLGVQRGY